MRAKVTARMGLPRIDADTAPSETPASLARSFWRRPRSASATRNWLESITIPMAQPYTGLPLRESASDLATCYKWPVSLLLRGEEEASDELRSHDEMVGGQPRMLLQSDPTQIQVNPLCGLNCVTRGASLGFGHRLEATYTL